MENMEPVLLPFISRPLVLGDMQAGDSIKVTITRSGVETTELELSVPTGKTLTSGRLLLRGEIA